MTGDIDDIMARLKAVLPSRWFADETPTLDGILAGLAAGWAWVFSLFTYAAAQTRIATATDVWLDVIARDFFGNRVLRRPTELDDAFKLRIQKALWRDRATRNALSSALTDLTGRTPKIFEPAHAADTGGYGSLTQVGAGSAWGLAGGWGSLTMPFQCFVIAYRPASSGIASVAGWGNGQPGCGAGAYGVGAIEYATLSMVQGQITDADIYQTIADVMPVAALAWTRISN
jgi:hypothetical protein